MIAHQYVGVNFAAFSLGHEPELGSIEQVVFLNQEAWLPVVAALDHVLGYCSEMEAVGAWHVVACLERDAQVATVGSQHISANLECMGRETRL